MKEYPVSEWADLYLGGYTMLEVAGYYAVGSYTVWRKLTVAGVPMRHGQSKNLWRIRPSHGPAHCYRVTVGRDRKKHIVHRACWEHHCGPIPEGYIIHHKNGDSTDHRIENLACMSSSEHIRLHHRAGNPP